MPQRATIATERSEAGRGWAAWGAAGCSFYRAAVMGPCEHRPKGRKGANGVGVSGENIPSRT